MRWERKQVSVFFADLCESTTRVVHDDDPEAAQAYLVEAAWVIRASVEAYGGTVFQVRGDGVVAVFGWPIAQEDHPMRACLAAAALLRSGGGESPMRFRVGISSGECLLGPDAHFPALPSVQGKHVHLASRLECTARPGTALICASTRKFIEPLVECQRSAEVVRDFEGEAAYELDSAFQQSPAAPLLRKRHLSPRFGRDDIWDELRGIAQDVKAGHLRTVGFVGEAGVGKSRVVHDLVRDLRDQGFHDIGVAARSYATHIPFSIIEALARQLLGVSSEATQVEQLATARQSVAARRGAPEMTWAAVSDLLNLGSPDSRWRSLPPAERRRHTAQVLRWLIGSSTESGPLVIVIDDVHLADPDSQRLLGSALRKLGHLPVLVCATYRQEFRNEWLGTAWSREYLLGPLPEADLARLARVLLGNDASLEALVQGLVERATGNPFLLEQMIISLVDNCSLVGLPGAYRCTVAEPLLSVPARVAALIHSQVDRLAPDGKAVVESAAVVGGAVPAELIAAMLGQSPSQTHELLRTAQAVGLMVEVDHAGGPRFEFRHGLVQEALYARLTRPDRRRLHHAAFRALHERLAAAGQLDENARLLASHAADGGAWPEAADHALRAMSRFVERSANEDAWRMFEQGLEAVKQLDDKQRWPRELALRMEVLGALLPQGKIVEIAANLEVADELTTRLGDHKRRAGVLLQLATIEWTHGKYRAGLQAASRAEAIGIELGSRSIQMGALQSRMMLNHALGRYTEATADGHRLQQAFQPELQSGRLMIGWAVMPSINVQAFLADCAWRLGDPEGAQRICDAAYAGLAGTAHTFSRMLMDFVQAEIWIGTGRYRQAAELLEVALAACKHDLITMAPPILAMLSGCMARCGRAEEALLQLEAATEQQLHLKGGRYNEYYFPKNMSVILAELGRWPEAVAAAERARSSAALFEQRGHEIDALIWLAECERRSELPHAAREHFELASTWSRQAGMLPAAMACEQGLATLDTGPASPYRGDMRHG